MTDSTVTDDLAALYLAGALPDDEARAFVDRLAAGWPAGEAALRDLTGAVRALTDVEPAAPPTAIKGRLLAALDARSIPGVTFRFREDDGFVRSRFPGIALRMLHLDPSRRQFTCLMRLDPGAVYPGHAHDGPEECLILEGEILVGDVRLRAGDYQRAEPGSDHIVQRTETGALLYLTAPLSLLEQ